MRQPGGPGQPVHLGLHLGRGAGGPDDFRRVLLQGHQGLGHPVTEAVRRGRWQGSHQRGQHIAGQPVGRVRGPAHGPDRAAEEGQRGCGVPGRAGGEAMRPSGVGGCGTHLPFPFLGGRGHGTGGGAGHGCHRMPQRVEVPPGRDQLRTGEQPGDPDPDGAYQGEYRGGQQGVPEYATVARCPFAGAVGPPHAEGVSAGAGTPWFRRAAVPLRHELRRRRTASIVPPPAAISPAAVPPSARAFSLPVSARSGR